MYHLTAHIHGVSYRICVEKPLSLAIPLDFWGAQPNHFGAPLANAQPVRAGSFIGDTAQGGSCNVDTLTLVPHCNGTHTECKGHIENPLRMTLDQLSLPLVPVYVGTVMPCQATDTKDTYTSHQQAEDWVISQSALKAAFGNKQSLSAWVIRTLPNEATKKTRCYTEGEAPPYFTFEAMDFMLSLPVRHLLVDFPSIDRMYDGGKMHNHRLFWTASPTGTITEMIFVDPAIQDGLYLLDLQVPAFRRDAAPSRPLLYPLEPL